MALSARADLDYTKRVGLGMKLDCIGKGHQDYAIVIDKAGKIRGMYDATSKSDCERLQKRLLECLEAEKPPPSDLAATRRRGNDIDLNPCCSAAAHPLVHVNASLNAIATVLLVVGLVLIKQRPRRCPQAGDAHGVRRVDCFSRLLSVVPLPGRQREVHASGRRAIRVLRDPC